MGDCSVLKRDLYASDILHALKYSNITVRLCYVTHVHVLQIRLIKVHNVVPQYN